MNFPRLVIGRVFQHPQAEAPIDRVESAAFASVHSAFRAKGEKMQNGLRPVDIDWAWIVERRRRVTPDEIRERPIYDATADKVVTIFSQTLKEVFEKISKE
jgi:hypothetical protein